MYDSTGPSTWYKKPYFGGVGPWTKRVDGGLRCKENGSIPIEHDKKQKGKNVTITSSKRTHSFSLQDVMS